MNDHCFWNFHNSSSIHSENIFFLVSKKISVFFSDAILTHSQRFVELNHLPLADANSFRISSGEAFRTQNSPSPPLSHTHKNTRVHSKRSRAAAANARVSLIEEKINRIRNRCFNNMSDFSAVEISSDRIHPASSRTPSRPAFAHIPNNNASILAKYFASISFEWMRANKILLRFALKWSRGRSSAGCSPVPGKNYRWLISMGTRSHFPLNEKTRCSTTTFIF